MFQKFSLYKLRKIIFLISFLYLSAIGLLIYQKKLNLGIDFTGGNEISITINNEHDLAYNLQKIKEINNLEVEFSEESSNEFVIKTKLMDIQNLQTLKTDLNKKFNNKITFQKTNFIGPQISKTIIKSALTAIVCALIAMFIYLLIRFNMQFAIGGIYALMHDVLFIIGFLCLTKIEITAITISAILTTIGYSINDTVVIFDRIRENIADNPKYNIEKNVNNAVCKTLKRTLLTSMTTLISIVALLIFGGEMIKDFSFSMIVGIIIGTFSSIFISIFAIKSTYN